MFRRLLGRHERRGIGTRGFGLVEVMVALSILGLALAYSTQLQGGAMNLIQSNQDSMTAMADLQTAMEQVLLQPHDNIPTAYPAGTYTYPSATFRAITDNAHLTNEAIIVAYPLGSTADPLEIQLTLTFRDIKGRTQRVSLSTMKTR